MAIRTVTAIAAVWRVAGAKRGEVHGVIIGDVSQAFIHAPIDQQIATRVPETLEGIPISIEGAEHILHAGEWIELLMALYGYRKAPRLWQDYFVECVEQCRIAEL